MPSSLGSVDVLRHGRDVEAGAAQERLGVGLRLERHVGDLRRRRALRHRQRDLRALRDLRPAGGLLRDDAAGGLVGLDLTCVTTKPSPLSAPTAFASGCPTTSGIWIGRGPRETLIRTFVPRRTRSPGAGFWPVTVFSSAPEKSVHDRR